MTKSSEGRFLEDFTPGEQIVHAVPRTMTAGDRALHTALTGSRFVLTQSDEFARASGHPSAPLDDLLVFHVAFGKSVPDISLNAVANLGYAECRFMKPVYVGDTLSATSEIIGIKENSNGRTGIVHARTRAANQRGEAVLSFVRWVMVNRRGGPARTQPAPALADSVGPGEGAAFVPAFDATRFDATLSGSPHRFGDYSVGERIDHGDGVTVEEAEHMLATRLYHNTAKVHFDALRFGRRIVYGGHVMSIARALSFNGLANAFKIAAINGGRHVAPLHAGGTVYAWSEVVAASDIPGRSDIGALRLVTRATKDLACDAFPTAAGDAEKPGIILELDYWALIPR